MNPSGCRRIASTSTSPTSKPATGAGRETPSVDASQVARGQWDVARRRRASLLGSTVMPGCLDAPVLPLTPIGAGTHSASMKRTRCQALAPLETPKREVLPVNSMNHFLVCLAVVGSLAAASAAHSPLLPRPQQVQYESGTL